MRILAVVGACPQFIKAAPVSKALREAGHSESLVHTGQHYDLVMSQVFFDELGIPQPAVNLGIGSGSHGWQTGQMLIGLEEVMQAQQPEWVLVCGDTNSMLAGALAAVKLHIPRGPRGSWFALLQQRNARGTQPDFPLSSYRPCGTAAHIRKHTYFHRMQELVEIVTPLLRQRGKRRRDMGVGWRAANSAGS